MNDRMAVLLDEQQLLCRRLGDRLQDVYCTFWLFHGEVDRSEVFEVTLFFQSGLVFRFGPTAFGHDLRVFHDRWEDPLIEPLEEEQRRDIEEHGRTVELCVNDQAEFCPLIGKPLLAVGELFYVHEIIGQERVGYAFHFAEGTVFYVANTADTVWVSRSVDPKVFGERLLEAAAAS